MQELHTRLEESFDTGPEGLDAGCKGSGEDAGGAVQNGRWETAVRRKLRTGSRRGGLALLDRR